MPKLDEKRDPNRFTAIGPDLAAVLSGEISFADALAVPVGWSDKVTGENFTVIPKNLPQGLIAVAAIYGLRKLPEDRTSGVEPDDKLDERAALLAQFSTGVFKAPRAASTRVVRAEIEALAKLAGASVAAVQASIRGASVAEVKKMYSHPDVAKLATEIREARAAAGDVDLSKFTK